MSQDRSAGHPSQTWKDLEQAVVTIPMKLRPCACSCCWYYTYTCLIFITCIDVKAMLADVWSICWYSCKQTSVFFCMCTSHRVQWDMRFIRLYSLSSIVFMYNHKLCFEYLWQIHVHNKGGEIKWCLFPIQTASDSPDWCVIAWYFRCRDDNNTAVHDETSFLPNHLLNTVLNHSINCLKTSLVLKKKRSVFFFSSFPLDHIYLISDLINVSGMFSESWSIHFSYLISHTMMAQQNYSHSEWRFIWKNAKLNQTNTAHTESFQTTAGSSITERVLR